MNVLDDLAAGSGAVNVAGVTFNAGTLRATVIAAVVVVGLGVWVRCRITAGRPGRLQLAWEAVVGGLDQRVSDSTGRPRALVVPLAVALFAFILVANLLRVVPGTSGFLPNATADLNLTVALTVVVLVVTHVAAIRARGATGYLRHYLEPYWWLAPINVLTEMVRPVTLALRLFGTAFAGGLGVALIGELIPPAVAPLPHAVWALFDLAIGVMQAVIFALLAVLYYESAVGSPALPATTVARRKEVPL
ncbi:MAG: F0F1 ATP synthase subunit A [Pseudonocardiaceae bacterium]